MRLSSKQGSALLIVLGLLGFLMISAVALSIAMRTERAASSTYHKNIVAKELLTAAFADARISLEYSFDAQLRDANNVSYPLDDVSERNRFTLTPFALTADNTDPNKWRFARLLSSAPTSWNSNTAFRESSVAYLLDEETMNHIPPYIAGTVASVLGASSTFRAATDISAVANYGVLNNGFENVSCFNAPAMWKDVWAIRNFQTSDNDTDDPKMADVVLGRMAWTIINVSDGLDINAMPHMTQKKRGIGVAGCDFALAAYQSNANGEDTDNVIVAPSSEPNFFFTMADLSRAVVFEADTGLKLGRDHWGDSILNKNERDIPKLFAPFVPYSYWPVTHREDYNDPNMSTTNPPLISCADVATTDANWEDPSIPTELRSAFSRIMTANTDPAVATLNILQLDILIDSLKDYLDDDVLPSSSDGRILDTMSTGNVEAIPMIAALAYNWEDELEEAFYTNLQNKLIDTLNKQPLNPPPTSPPTEWPVDFDFKLQDVLPEILLNVYTAFPYRVNEAREYSLEVQPFLGVSLYKGNTYIGAQSVGMTAPAESTKSTPVYAVGDDWEYEAHDLTFDFNATSDFKTPDGNSEVPLAVGTLLTPQADTTFSMVLDVYFAASVNEGGLVDLAPVYAGADEPDMPYSEFKSTYDRENTGDMEELAERFFHLSFVYTLTVTTELKEIPGEEDAPTTYELTCTEVEMVPLTTLPGATPPVADSPKFGVWETLDPRYNWLSPSTGGASVNTLLGEALADESRSSSQWIFTERDIQAASAVGEMAGVYLGHVKAPLGIQNQHEIFYSVNNCAQMFSPAEIGFLPYPIHREDVDNNALTPAVIKLCNAAYMRTLPVFPHKVNGIDIIPTPLVDAFTTGHVGNEEHRGLMHAYAAQDDKWLSNHLRKLVLSGMPSTLSEAVGISKENQEDGGSELYTIPGVDRADVPSPSSVSTVSPFDVFVDEFLFRVNATDTNDDPTENHTHEDGWADDGSGRPGGVDFLAEEKFDLAGKFEAYNTQNATTKLTMADATAFYAMARESFGDRQQLFLYILTAENVAVQVGRNVADSVAMARAKAVALVWRDAYGFLPDRIIYFQTVY